MLEQVDIHARQSAVIVHDHTGEWLSKKRYQRAGEILELQASSSCGLSPPRWRNARSPVA